MMRRVDGELPQPYQTLIGRLLIDPAFCQRLVLEPAEAIAAAEIVDVDEAHLATLTSMSVPERQVFVRTTLGSAAVRRWTGWWGWEMTDPEPEDS
jgi:hypothetical protein